MILFNPATWVFVYRAPLPLDDHLRWTRRECSKKFVASYLVIEQLHKQSAKDRGELASLERFQNVDAHRPLIQRYLIAPLTIIVLTFIVGFVKQKRRIQKQI